MRESFESWVREHHAAVYRSAWRIVRDDEDARDVTQEVFLRALRDPGEIARAQSPEGVLRWLAVKGALALLRGERNRRHREQETAMRRPERIDADRPEQRELAGAVTSVLAELPDELRLATVLRFQEGLTFAQVGECLGVVEPTAFERVKRAVEKLRLRLGSLGHAGALAQVEQWLALEEPVAVPVGLASKLLALSAGTGAAAAATVAAAAASTAASKLLPIAAVLALAIGGGVLLLRPTARDAPSIEAARATAAAAVETRDGDTPTLVARRESEPAPAGAPASSTAPGAPAAAVATLTGTIVDDDGRAVAGASIAAESWEGASKGSSWLRNAVTGASGAFTLELPVVIESGQHYWLKVEQADFITHRTEPCKMKPDETTDLGRVAVRRNGAARAGDYVLAVIVEDEAGRPIEGAWVRVYRLHEALDGTPVAAEQQCEGGGATDATGAARVAGTRIGRKLIEIDARRLGFRRDLRMIELEWTGFQERRFTLEEGRRISGRLVFPAGSDAASESPGRDASPHGPGARIYATGSNADEWLDADLSADGSFRIAGLDPGRYAVHVRSSFSPAVVDGVEAGGEELVIRLKRTDDVSDVGAHMGEIHGRLVDAATGAEVVAPWDAVECELVDDGGDETSLRDDVLPGLASPQMRQTAFDSDFREPPPSALFHVTGLEDGNYVAVARVAGYAAGFSRMVPIAGRALAKEVVVLLFRPAEAAGVVVDEQGAPVVDAVVFACGAGSSSRRLLAAADEWVRTSADSRAFLVLEHARTDEHGRFRLSGLPPQLPCVLAAVHPRFAPASGDALALTAGANVDAGRLQLAPRRE